MCSTHWSPVNHPASLPVPLVWCNVFGGMQTHMLSYCAKRFPPASAGTICLFPQVFEILLSRGYSETNFRDDLKNLYMKLGLENKMMIFLFTDAHVAEEGFLELINNMLTSGTACPVGTHVTGMSVPATAVRDGAGSLRFVRVGHPWALFLCLCWLLFSFLGQGWSM